MEDLKQQLRLLIAERLLNLVLKIAPDDSNLSRAIFTYYTKEINDGKG